MSFELWKFVRGNTRVICRSNQNRKKQEELVIHAVIRMNTCFRQAPAFGDRFIAYMQAALYRGGVETQASGKCVPPRQGLDIFIRMPTEGHSCAPSARLKVHLVGVDPLLVGRDRFA
ncbi:hypothetical protein [Noviherbaspirillum sp. ST 5-3]|uniref:hypothetical protein n=1 Tax=Noviherbaspirillum sp. ST 5-3 TaxID=3349878 RepID=UPI0039174BEA